MPVTKAKADEALHKQIEQYYYKHCAGTRIGIMDILKLYDDARKAHAEGQDLEQAVIQAIAKYNC